MSEPIENYNSQKVVKQLKKQAFIVWFGVLTVAFLWVSAIVSAPLLESFGENGFARPIYGFFSYLCHQLPERSFHYHEHPFAVCSRCFGFYFGVFVGFLLYPLFRKTENIEPLPRIWLFLAMIPMGIDWALGFFEIWENTHFSRFFTGNILGLACAVFVVPALVEIVQLLRKPSFKAKN